MGVNSITLSLYKPVMTAVTSKMSRMVLLYTLILCMVSLPTNLPKHFLVETADNQGGEDYSPPWVYWSKGQQNKGSENSDKAEEVAKKGDDYGCGRRWCRPLGR